MNGEEEEGKEGRVFKEIFPPSRGGTLVNLIRAVKQTYTSAEEEEERGEEGGRGFSRELHTIVAWSYVKKEATYEC